MLIKECKWSLLLTTCAQVRLGNVSAISFSYGSEKRTLVKQVSGKLDHQLSFIEKKEQKHLNERQKFKITSDVNTCRSTNYLSTKCFVVEVSVDERLSTKCCRRSVVDEMLVDKLPCRRNACRRTIVDELLSTKCLSTNHTVDEWYVIRSHDFRWIWCG